MSDRSVLQSLVVDVAGSSHKCSFNKRHAIRKGKKRLKIKVGMGYQTYCAACAEKFIATGITNLTLKLTELDVKQVD